MTEVRGTSCADEPAPTDRDRRWDVGRNIGGGSRLGSDSNGLWRRHRHFVDIAWNALWCRQWGMQTIWTTRKALPSDAESIATHACYREDDAGRRAGYAEWVRPRVGAGRYLGLFAVMNGQIIGGAGVNLLDWGPTRANPGGQLGRVVNVFTMDAFRRKGIARALVAGLLEQCEALGVREFNLGATPEGRDLYRTLGFAEYTPEMRRRVVVAAPSKG